MVSVTPQVDECGFGAVRPAKNIDLIVAHGLADLVQVIGSNRCGVLSWISLLVALSSALMNSIERVRLAKDCLCVVKIQQCALQGIRFAGAPLVYQDNIAQYTNPGHVTGQREGLCRTLSWAARERK